MPSPSDKFPKKITADFNFSFEAETDGLYVMGVATRCHSANQAGVGDGEDLRVEIDGRQFRELPSANKPQYYNIPPAWNGAELKGLKKTIFFIIRLAKGEYSLKFIPHGGAIIEQEPEIKLFDNLSNLAFDINQRAEDGDRHSWYTFVLVDLPLGSVITEASVGWHWWDGDDIKLIVDGKIIPNSDSRSHHDWLWTAGFWQMFTAKRESKSVTVNLPRDIHFKIDNENFNKITDPLLNAGQSRKKAWYKSYDIAQSLLAGEIKIPTTATHFHGRGVDKDWFMSRIVPNGKFLKQIDDSFFYWSPN